MPTTVFNANTFRRRMLLGRPAVMFIPNGGTDFGLDSVTEVPTVIGVVTSASRDGVAIRAITDMTGRVHQWNGWVYTLPREIYACGLFAVMNNFDMPTPFVDTVANTTQWLRGVIHEGWHRAAVIAHDLDQACECYQKGWKK